MSKKTIVFIVILGLLTFFKPASVKSEREKAFNIRDTGYHYPRGKDTFLYAVFMIDHSEWPKSTKIGISRYGFGFVLQCIGNNEHRFTPLRIQLKKIEDLLEYVEKNFSKLKSKPKSRNEPYYIHSRIAYSQPSLSYVSQPFYTDVREEVSPLYEWLIEVKEKAEKIWSNIPEKGKGSHNIGILKTEDIEFLDHMMNTLHNVPAWRIKEDSE